jgi:hypothetical protein
MLGSHINVGANISISLKGLNEELRTPGKYQVRIETSTKEINLKDYGFADIKSETHRFGAVSCDRELCLNNLSPSGSFVLDVTVTIKDLSALSTHYVLKNPLKAYNQIALEIAEDLLADEERAANTATDSGDYRAQTKRSRILGANHEEQIIATQLET